MTKFILHGGIMGKDLESTKNFFSEIVKDAKAGAEILLCYFARKEELWQERFLGAKEIIKEVCPNKEFNFVLAQKDNFAEQLVVADVIYLHGGSRELLDPEVLKIDNFSELVKNKIVAGSSAGTNVLAKYYFNNDGSEFFIGSGALPIKTYCHYGASYGKTAEEAKEILEQLKQYKENLPVYALADEEFIVINQ